jgi:hypothetical protein
MAKAKPAQATAVDGLKAVAKLLDNPATADACELLTPEERYAIKKYASGGHDMVPLTVMARLGARLHPAAVERLYQETRIMGRAVGRVVLEMLFEKATKGEECPFDGPVLLAIAKGFGYLTDAKPVDADERDQQVAQAQAVHDMSNDELQAAILARVQKTHEK